MGVFADVIERYYLAGWRGVIPVPPGAKYPPPTGYTGAGGADTAPAVLVGWAITHADHSVALRMPAGVIGIDVDHYRKGVLDKRGGHTLAEYEDKWGKLPPTWASTARGTDLGVGLSRTLFYRVPPGRYATKLGDSIEIIQRHHRYAVVAPSPHLGIPGCPNAAYRWYDPTGVPVAEVPKPEEFPELPQAWIAGLADGATDAGPAPAQWGRGQALLEELAADARPPCAEITSAAQNAAQELTAASAGNRHDTATARAHHLVQLAAAGHPGVGPVLAALGAQWEALTTGEGRADEWDRMLLTSARKAVTVVGDRQVNRDPCLLSGGMAFSTPAPADDRPDGADHPLWEGEGPAQVHSVREFIGTHAFDPQGALDQVLAQAVLERTYPALRYARDDKGWLLRGPERWELREDLASWAVAELFGLMPRGEGDADKDSDAYAQAVRRKRFGTSAQAGAIAAKAKALVAAGTHPCSLALTDLDRNPEVLWAGGIPWDLRASTEALQPAPAHPGTPHLHSAAVAPQIGPTPRWDAFLAAVWPDPEIRAWALRVLAIAATGYPDAALPILLGESGRGKTQVIVLIMRVLGTYAHAADPRLLASGDNSHASIVYALKGRRLSFIDEGPREGRLAAERLKQLTGGAELTGNRMRGNPVTFAPTHTLVLTTNEPPTLTDPAIRRRARLIPCEGDPETVAAARSTISPAVWRAEAPGVLASLIREAGAWLADGSTGSQTAAPESIRWLAELLADEQNRVRDWINARMIVVPAERTVEDGMPGEDLHVAYAGYCRDIGARSVETLTAFGRVLTTLGHHPVKGGPRNLRYRPLRHRPAAPWEPTMINRTVAEGPGQWGAQTVRDQNPRSSGVFLGVPDSSDSSNPISTTTKKDQDHIVDDHDIRNMGENRDQLSLSGTARERASDQPKPARTVRKPNRPEVQEAKRSAREAARAIAIREAGGPTVPLPALVCRGEPPVAVTVLEAIERVRLAVARDGGMCTVDIESSGYPIGHRDYAVRTVQLGDLMESVDFDPNDRAQAEAVKGLLAEAPTLRAFSATADLAPLAHAGLVDHESAWARMYDTVIPAKLADPAGAGSDAVEGLKALAGAVLGADAVAPAADRARAELFKAGGWLSKPKIDTPLARNGWAQVPLDAATMVTYAASDVLDTAALARRLPDPGPALWERERIAQRLTARISYRGVPIDAEHAEKLLSEHVTAQDAAAEVIRGYGIDNPGSNLQVGSTLLALGAQLPLTPKSGKPSVAEGALIPLRDAPGDLGQLVRALLEYNKHDTAIGTFLRPYATLCRLGDGRARPTVYTMEAATGRMSCVRPNFQNIPREGGFRKVITADPGYLLIGADFSGVELRVAAALSQDQHLLDIIRKDDAAKAVDPKAKSDIHWKIAQAAYGPEATKSQRYNVKRGVFGRLYGSGVPGIARTLGIAENEAGMIVEILDDMTPGLSAWSAQLRNAVKRGETHFPTYSGRVIHLDRHEPHKAGNYCIQGTARELIIDALIKWSATRWGACVLWPVHDELDVMVPESEAQEALDALVSCMQTEYMGVPILSEPSEPSIYWRDSS